MANSEIDILINEISKLPNEIKQKFKSKIDYIYKEYDNLSLIYQQNKGNNKIPLN